jgi:homoisocitrate dehydrogenase
MYTICLIPGDGVGREVIPAAAQALSATLQAGGAGRSARFIEAEAGWACFQRLGTSLPKRTLAAVASADATLFGATQSPIAPPPSGEDLRQTGQGKEKGAEYSSPILALRRSFDLYANLRPAMTLLPDGPAVDLLIVRENTEGLYSGREHRDGDTAIAERVITRRASDRIARVAFEQARRRSTERPPHDEVPTSFREGKEWVARGAVPAAAQAGKSDDNPRTPRVTVVHKANVLKVTDGLFREACMAVAEEFPDVAVEEMLVDTTAMWLARNPGRFDVIVTTNLFGDILSDLAAGLTGGLGIAPSANLGSGRVAVFEPVHGSAPDIAGRGIANPVGAILSSAMLLDHLGEHDAAARVRRAIKHTLAAGVVTPDVGGCATTAEVTAAICRDLTGRANDD